MSNVKTAISLDAKLFQKANHIAETLQVSRSRLFAIAIEKLIREYEAEEVTEALNAVYTDYTPTAEDEKTFQLMRKHQRKLVEETW